MTRHSPEKSPTGEGSSRDSVGGIGESNARPQNVSGSESDAEQTQRLGGFELSNERSHQLAQRVVAVLDREAQDLPETVTAALAGARKRAVEQAGASRARYVPRSLWIGSLAAGVMALGLVLFMPERHTEPGVDQLLALAEVSDGEWEAVQDLEFAVWLSELPDEALDDDRRG